MGIFSFHGFFYSRGFFIPWICMEGERNTPVQGSFPDFCVIKGITSLIKACPGLCFWIVECISGSSWNVFLDHHGMTQPIKKSTEIRACFELKTGVFFLGMVEFLDKVNHSLEGQGMTIPRLCGLLPLRASAEGSLPCCTSSFGLLHGSSKARNSRL